MFEEFLLPAYKDIYGCYKENGVELIVHHSDSYAATLVPYMIEMGIDIWQGVMTTGKTCTVSVKESVGGSNLTNGTLTVEKIVWRDYRR